jgi:hypothetical protein
VALDPRPESGRLFRGFGDGALLEGVRIEGREERIMQDVESDGRSGQLVTGHGILCRRELFLATGPAPS